MALFGGGTQDRRRHRLPLPTQKRQMLWHRRSKPCCGCHQLRSIHRGPSLPTRSSSTAQLNSKATLDCGRRQRPLACILQLALAMTASGAATIHRATKDPVTPMDQGHPHPACLLRLPLLPRRITPLLRQRLDQDLRRFSTTTTMHHHSPHLSPSPRRAQRRQTTTYTPSSHTRRQVVQSRTLYRTKAMWLRQRPPSSSDMALTESQRDTLAP